MGKDRDTEALEVFKDVANNAEGGPVLRALLEDLVGFLEISEHGARRCAGYVDDPPWLEMRVSMRIQRLQELLGPERFATLLRRSPSTTRGLAYTLRSAITRIRQSFGLY